jgi:hypothetical protein
MRTRTGLVLLACCMALAACTAAAPKGPDTTVSTPSVGRPPPPASAQAALSSEAFTPYVALGASSNDGLAPGESQNALAHPCMSAAGYPGWTSGVHSYQVTFPGGPESLAFTQPWGAWGYLGAADAQQYGFLPPPSAGPTIDVLPMLGIGAAPSMPAAEQTAALKCNSIMQDFRNATLVGPLASIITLSNDIITDVGQDPAVKAATGAWSACMAKNGYSFDQPQAASNQELQALNGPPSASANRAQIAMAVTDADCTQSSDLAGIYFAVQASYEQQLVTANQQALAAAVSAYRAAYQKELTQLAAQLRTAKTPFLRTHPLT